MTYDSDRHIRRSLQLNSIGVLALCLPFIVVTVSCSKASEQAPPETATSSTKSKVLPDSFFSYVEVKEKTTTSSSPLGYWEKTLRYPQLKNNFNSQAVTVINESVVQLTNKYKCETEGDHDFESEVTLANSVLISFKYNAMWLCDTMPRPDSAIGAATLDLETGAEIKLADEVLDKATAEELRNIVLSKFKKLINEKNKVGANCPLPTPSDMFYLYDLKSLFISVSATAASTSQAESA